MKLKSFLLCASAATCFAAASQAAVVINFSAGDLRTANGAALMPVGGLLELVADTSRNGFSIPTAGASVPVGGDDVVIARFALNGNLAGGPGNTQNGLNINTVAFAGLDLNDPILFRWFPTTTYSATAEPAGGAQYGSFRTDTNGVDGSTIAFLYPAEGTTNTLNFITATEGGANANTTGFANSTVAGVPEPSTWAILAAGVAGLACAGVRRRKAA